MTIQYRIICPECSAKVIVASPEAMLWELCPACRRHVWDEYDAMMADRVTQNSPAHSGRHVHANN